MKKIIVFLIGLILIVTFASKEEYVIPNDSIRFRVIPNSNNVEDIFMKEKVLDVINKDLLYYKPKDLNDTRTFITSSLPTIDKNINDTFKYYNYDESFSINYGLNFFPKKEYQNKVYKEGEYESLVITIGKGKGDNFWCVLFPPLCMLEAQESQEIEYDFFLVKLYKKIIGNK